MSAKYSIENIEYYQGRLHELHEGKFLFINPTLPDITSFGNNPDPTTLETAYLIHCVADMMIERDLKYSTCWNEDYLEYMDKNAKLGEYLQLIGKIPSQPPIPTPAV